MKKLYSTDNRVLLNLLESALKVDNIPCLVKNLMPPAAGEVPPVIAWPEIWIMNDSDYEKAVHVLKGLLANEQATRQQPSWRCAHCNEVNEPQFEICWCCISPK